MKNWVLYSGILITSCLGLKTMATEKEPVNLSEFAKKELNSVDINKISAEELDPINPLATINVTTPKPLAQTQVHWSLGVQYQKLHLSGQKHLKFIQQSNLSSSSETMNHFSVSLFRKNRLRAAGFREWGFGLVTGGGRSNVTAHATSGRPLTDVQLQTLFIAGEILAAFSLMEPLGMEMSLMAGQRNFTQVSSNTAGRFTETAGFLAPGIKIKYSMSPKTLVGIKYENHHYPTQPDIVSAAHNYQFLLEYLFL